MLNFLAESIPLNAEPLPWFGHLFSNSVVVAVIVAALVLWFARRATKNMELVPNRG